MAPIKHVLANLKRDGPTFLLRKERFAIDYYQSCMTYDDSWALGIPTGCKSTYGFFFAGTAGGRSTSL